MHVVDVMTTEVLAVAPDTSLEIAARILGDRCVSGAPVVAADGRPVGVVTLSDLVNQGSLTPDGYPLYYVVGPESLERIAEDVRVGPGQVADVMSPFVLSIEASATVLTAAARLVSADVHRILVLDQQRLVGIASSLDLLRGLTQESG